MRLGEQTGDNSTLKWCLSLVRQVKFSLHLSLKTENKIKKKYVFTGVAVLDFTLEGLINL